MYKNPYEKGRLIITFNIKFPEAGMVSPVPTSKVIVNHTASTWFYGFFKGKLEFQNVLNPEAMHLFDLSLGNKKLMYDSIHLENFLVFGNFLGTNGNGTHVHRPELVVEDLSREKRTHTHTYLTPRRIFGMIRLYSLATCLPRLLASRFCSPSSSPLALRLESPPLAISRISLEVSKSPSSLLLPSRVAPYLLYMYGGLPDRALSGLKPASIILSIGR
jgi:hypothetical protein